MALGGSKTTRLGASYGASFSVAVLLLAHAAASAAPAETRQPAADSKASPSIKKRKLPPAPAPKALTLPGVGPVYYYEPTGPSQRAFVYLHGRGGSAESECRSWAKLIPDRGFLICPSAPAPYGSGRTWRGSWRSARHITFAALAALEDRYGARFTRKNAVLIGFSEGAFVAMNLGVREPRIFSRWLILAANSKYWGELERQELKRVAVHLRRVYLLTGETDMVARATQDVSRWLRDANIPTQTVIAKQMGHELATERRPELYEAALSWLMKDLREGSSEPSGGIVPAAQSLDGSPPPPVRE